jgi:dihydrofolate synthase/folylpolyglutamate synthase
VDGAGRAAAALGRLRGLHPAVVDLSLDRVWRLLDALGNPQDALPPVAHVAGTNGKGSVVAFLKAMAAAAGHRVHAYTSPHLVRFNERLHVAGADIGDDALAAVLEEVEAANGGRPITFFEATTAAAFLAFARAPADLVLLETGLGGRLDATNVVARPAVTVLTPIALDHEAFLGPSLAAIAAEKAHILKPGVAAVVADQPPPAARVIEARAHTVGAPLIVEGRDFHVEAAGAGGLIFHGRTAARTLPAPALAGAHQIGNAGLALAAAEVLAATLDLPQAALAQGLRDVRWPGRLHRLTRGPLVAGLPAGWELWLDGAHNPAAAGMLAAVLDGWTDKPVDLIVGLLATKDADGFLAALGRRVDRLRTVPVPDADTGSGQPPEAVAAAARRHGIAAAAPAPSVPGALAGLTSAAGGRRVVVCGSLYLAGAVLRDNG